MSVHLVPLTGLALWLGMLYLDSKFEFKSPKKCNIVAGNDAPLMTRVLVNHNDRVRYGSLIFVWLCLSANLVLVGSVRPVYSYILLGLASVGILVFATAFSWRSLTKYGD